MKKAIFAVATALTILATTIAPSVTVYADAIDELNSRNDLMKKWRDEWIQQSQELAKDPAVQTEVDSIKACAIPLAIGEIKTDTLPTSTSVQYYKFTVPENHNFTITIDQIDKEGGWVITCTAENRLPEHVYCMQNNGWYSGSGSHSSATCGIDDLGFPGNESVTITEKCGQYETINDTSAWIINHNFTDTTWYIKVRGAWRLGGKGGPSWSPEGTRYSITVTTEDAGAPADKDDTETDDGENDTDDDTDEESDEDEPEELITDENNTYKTATTLKVDKTCTETLASTADTTDWFKFQVTGTGTASLAFQNKGYALSKRDAGWTVNIYKNPSAKPIGTIKTNASKSAKFNVKKGTYYAKVSASKKSEAIGRKYTLKWNYTSAPKSVKLTSVKGGKKSETIRWTKSKNATGYYIYRATSKNSKYTKIATVKSRNTVKYVDKKSLKSKRTYYYKVVAYKTSKGLTATSTASAVRGAKTK